MTISFRGKVGLIACSIAAAATLPVTADLVFDNSKADLKLRFNPGTSEVGDQIILSGAGFLTNFSFEYWGTNNNGGTSFAGENVQAQVRFYLNDGPLFNGYQTPGQMFFESPLFSVPNPTPRNTFVFSGADFPEGGLWLPGRNLTWSVQFSGLGDGDLLGLDIYNIQAAGTVGQDFPDYWRKVGTSWVLEQNSTYPVDFAARFEATIPEPSTAVLLLLGGLGAVLARRRDS